MDFFLSRTGKLPSNFETILDNDILLEFIQSINL